MVVNYLAKVNFNNHLVLNIHCSTAIFMAFGGNIINYVNQAFSIETSRG